MRIIGTYDWRQLARNNPTDGWETVCHQKVPERFRNRIVSYIIICHHFGVCVHVIAIFPPPRTRILILQPIVLNSTASTSL